jgi:hypothetical protein
MRRLSPSLSVHQHSALTPRLATERMRIVYPVRGIVQAARHFPCTATTDDLYVVGLVVSAMSTAVALIDAGSGLEAPLDAPGARDYCRPCGTSERSSRNYLGVLNLAPPYSLCCGSLRTTRGCDNRSSIDAWGPELLARRNSERMPGLKWAAYMSTRFMCGVAMASARRRHWDSSGPGRRTDSSDTHRHCRR